MKQGHNLHIIDGELVRRRRGDLGLTESYLGAMCGVSGSVIRRLESGWPQEELSARFLVLLAERLGVPLRTLVVDQRGDHDLHDDDPDHHHPDGGDPGAVGGPPRRTGPVPSAKPGARLGALLASADEPVPVEAILELTGWCGTELDEAVAELHPALDMSGQVLVDIGDALTIAADVCDVSADDAVAATKAAHARRRPNLPELRVIHKLIEGKIVRREDLDTAQGRVVQRLRTIGVLAPPNNVNMKGDPPELADDVSYSLMV